MANRYWVNGGTGNWSSTTNWSATSGGASGASVPTTTDDVFFDGAGNSNCTVDINPSGVTRIGSLLITSAYTSNINILNTRGIRVISNVELGANCTITSVGSGVLHIGFQGTTITCKTNGLIIDCNVRFGAEATNDNTTITLLDDFISNNNLSFQSNSTSSQTIINGFSIKCRGNLFNNDVNRITSGTSILLFESTQTQTLSGSGILTLSIQVNKTGGQLNISDLIFQGISITHINGLVNHTGTLTIGGSLTLNTSGINWLNISFTNFVSATLTLSSNFNVTGNVSCGATNGTLNIVNSGGSWTSIGGVLSNSVAFTLNLANSITSNGLTSSSQQFTINNHSVNNTGNLTVGSSLVGTSKVILSGTGTWSGASLINMDVDINTSGTITLGGVAVVFGQTGSGTNPIFNYISGTINFGSTFLTIEQGRYNMAGVTWQNLRTGTNGTIVTLLADINCVNFTPTNGCTLNGAFNFNVNGNLTPSSNGIQGTATIRMVGTGIWSGNGNVRCNLTFDTAGTITVSGTVTYGTQNSTAGNLTYTAGTIISSSGTLNISGGTWNTSGMIWSNLFCNSNNTLINLVSDINCVNLQINNVTFTPSGGNNINISGDLNLSNQSTVGLQNSTTNYRMVGTGTISANHTTGRIAAPLVFNTLGTITLSGTIGYSNSTFTHTSGTVNAGTSTLTLGQATNFVINSTGFALNNLNPSTFSVTFSGTNGCTINNFSSGVVTAGVTHTFQSLRTYNIATLEVAGTIGSPATIRSSTPALQAIVTLTNASYNYSLNVTDINSGLGAVGFTSGGILTNATNWTTASAALYYIGSTNYSGANLWSVISGGSPISAITAPTSSDPVIFDANSGNCIMNVAGVAGSVNFANYTNTITFSNNLSVSGNITLGSGMIFAGAGELIYEGTTNSTLTSNGKEVGVVFRFGCGANHTITFADNWTFGENLILQSGASAVTMIYNGNNLLCKKSLLTNNSSSRVVYGTTKIQMIGSGDIGTVIANLNFGLDLEINTVGSYTIRNLTWGYLGGRTLKYTSGTVTHAIGTTLTLDTQAVATNVLDLNGIDFQTISMAGFSSPIYNLSSNLKCVTFSMGSGQFNNNTIYVTNLSVNSNVSGLYGTTLIYFNGWNGNGTWSGTGLLQLNVTIDTPNLLTVNDGVRLERTSAGTTFFTVTQQSQVVFNGTFAFVGTSPNAIEVTTPSNFMFNTLLVERATVLNLNNPIFCNNFSHNPAITNWFAVINNNSLTVMGSFTHYASFTNGLGGTGKLIMGGTGILQAGTNVTSGGSGIEFEINTNGVITITPNNTQSYSGIFRHVKGTVIANKSTVLFNSGATVLGASRMNLDNVQIAGGATITMDEFFSGKPQIPTKVISTTTANYTINFTDGFEKLAKNVRVSRCTIGKRGQLLLLSKGGFGVNNLGIRYYNQLPNGVSTDTQRFVNNNLAGMPPLRAVNMLVGDPVFT